MLSKEWPIVSPEESVGQHTKDHHNCLSGRIRVIGTFIHHQLILLEWCQDLEQSQR